MKTALDVPIDVLNVGERDFVGKIRRYGWVCTAVAEEDERPAFSYSTGLWLGYRHPELVIFGLKGEPAYQILWNAYQLVNSGGTLPLLGPTVTLFEGFEAYIGPIAKHMYSSYLGWSRWFYGGDDFTCLQIIWPDRAGMFPWNDGSDADYRLEQPDLSQDGWQRTIPSN